MTVVFGNYCIYLYYTFVSWYIYMRLMSIMKADAPSHSRYNKPFVGSQPYRFPAKFLDARCAGRFLRRFQVVQVIRNGIFETRPLSRC